MNLTFKCDQCGNEIEIYQFGPVFYVEPCSKCMMSLEDQVSDLEGGKAIWKLKSKR